MRPLRSLFIYVAAVFLVGALVSPWLYWTTQWAAKHFPAMESLAQHPFHRFVHRSMLAMAFIGLWPFARSTGATACRDLGLVKPAGQWSKLAGGFALGFGSLAGAALLNLAAGASSLNGDLPGATLLKHLFGASLTAVGVGVSEELLYRGALFGALRKAHHWVTALLVSSGVYAIVHFFQRPPAPAEVTWISGLVTLPQMLRGFAQVEALVPAFFALMLAGLILGLAYHRTGNLYFSIGLHAGWIFWLRFYAAVTIGSPLANPRIWGTSRLIDGWLTLLILVLVFGIAEIALRKKKASADGE